MRRKKQYSFEVTIKEPNINEQASANLAGLKINKIENLTLYDNKGNIILQTENVVVEDNV